MNIVKSSKTTSESPLVGRVRRKVVAKIAREDAYLTHVRSRRSVRTLDADTLRLLGACLAADRALLTAIAAEACSATTLAELHHAASRLRRLRREVHSVVVDQLQDIATLSRAAEANVVRLAALEAIIANHETAGQDTTSARSDVMAARLLNSHATLAISAARDAALLLTAMNGRNEIAVVAAKVRRISSLLDRVDETLMLVERPGPPRSVSDQTGCPRPTADQDF